MPPPPAAVASSAMSFAEDTYQNILVRSISNIYLLIRLGAATEGSKSLAHDGGIPLCRAAAVRVLAAFRL